MAKQVVEGENEGCDYPSPGVDAMKDRIPYDHKELLRGLVTKGLTQQAICAELDVSQSTISRWNKGSYPELPHYFSLVDFARRYGVIDHEYDASTAVSASQSHEKPAEMRQTMSDRLREARIAAGLQSAMAAAKAMGIGASTYGAHENGQNEFKVDAAERYAQFFGTTAEYLLIGRGSKDATHPVVGSNVPEAEPGHFRNRVPILTIPAPQPTENMIALSVRGYSMGAIRDGWVVYFNNNRTPPHDGLVDELCVIKTADDRVFLRFIKKGRRPGKWDLVSISGDPVLDVAIEWAERVEWLRPHTITQEEREALGGLKTYGEIVE